MLNSKDLIIREDVLEKIFNHKLIGKSFASLIISEVLGFEYNIVLNNLVIKSNNIKVSDFTADFLLQNFLQRNVLLIDIRISYTSCDFLSFLYELDMSLFNYSKRKKKIIQIFIDSKDRFHKNKFIYNVCCMEKNELLKGNKFFEKYYINLQYVRNISSDLIFYEKNKLIRSLYFCIYFNKKRLNELYANDILMKKIMRELGKILSYDYDDLYYFNQDNLKYIYEEFFLNDCIKLGMDEEKNKIIKSLYYNGATLDLIRRSTNISLDDIKKIIES